jgi:hypothetical protein
VTYHGAPVTGGTITFQPVNGKGGGYLGPINPDGTYSFSDVPLGDMKVIISTAGVGESQDVHMKAMMDRAGVVAKPPEGQAVVGPPADGKRAMKVEIPQKYTGNDSPLQVTITGSSQNQDFDLVD